MSSISTKSEPSVTEEQHSTSSSSDNEKELSIKDEQSVINDNETEVSEEEKVQPESEPRKGEPFNYDDIMELHIGQLGKFQLRTFLWLCLPALFPGLIVMTYTFTGGAPDYR